MIKSVEFKNFKALVDATLPLNRFTLIVGPNGSGKSTAMQGIKMARDPDASRSDTLITASLRNANDITIEIVIDWEAHDFTIFTRSGWRYVNGRLNAFGPEVHGDTGSASSEITREINNALKSFQIYSFDPKSLAAPVQLPKMTLWPDGLYLAGVLDNLRDQDPERFEALNEELSRWLPEFNRILFKTSHDGLRSILLRTRSGHSIEASDLSHGTLFALGFITLAYLPNPPAIVCFEEPERGIHPRLLRDVRDAMYRLCYPEQYSDKRSPVQVIATTHSPYFLDLYKDHPEEVVIAHKDAEGVHFERLSEKPNLDEFLQDAPLGEVWYSGILGGVPSQP
ncbi:MAG TPA: ATP-binding protein [Pyrinomonadaceae bacterium]|nr:ATP-binding protein [Pyrinomonadaceae bacterium]